MGLERFTGGNLWNPTRFRCAKLSYIIVPCEDLSCLSEFHAKELSTRQGRSADSDVNGVATQYRYMMSILTGSNRQFLQHYATHPARIPLLSTEQLGDFSSGLSPVLSIIVTSCQIAKNFASTYQIIESVSSAGDISQNARL